MTTIEISQNRTTIKDKIVKIKALLEVEHRKLSDLQELCSHPGIERTPGATSGTFLFCPYCEKYEPSDDDD